MSHFGLDCNEKYASYQFLRLGKLWRFFHALTFAFSNIYTLFGPMQHEYIYKKKVFSHLCFLVSILTL